MPCESASKPPRMPPSAGDSSTREAKRQRYITPPRFEIIPVPRWADSPEVLRIAGIRGRRYETPTITNHGDASSGSESASDTFNESDTDTCSQSSSRSTRRPANASTTHDGTSKQLENVSTKHPNAANLGEDEGELGVEEEPVDSSTSLGKRARGASPGLESDDSDVIIVRRCPKPKLDKIAGQK